VDVGIGGSWLGWAIYQAAPQALFLPFPDSREPVFAIAAWQALFFSGLVLGYHRDRLGAVTRALDRPLISLLLVAATVALIFLSEAQRAGQLNALGIPGLTDDTFPIIFGKSHLGPGRVVAFVVVGALARQVATFLWAPVEHYLGWLLIPMGQKALLAYGLHLFLLGPFFHTFADAMFVQPASPLLNALIHAALVGVVCVVVKAHVDLQLAAKWEFVRQQEFYPFAPRRRSVAPIHERVKG
jgi:hypothetical protein